ncbi:MAG: thioredoxin family protein [Phycisphaerales bacterium]|nr:MAG: thioredoxin family protein [Phycisphaerales bacterium]
MALNRVWISCVLLILADGVLGAGQPATSSSGARTETGIAWVRSYQDAREVAKGKNRPMLVFFTASWCPWCHKMEDETLNQEEVVSSLRRFACVKIDVEKHRDMALAYAVSSLPRTIVINTHDEMVGDWLGYRDVEQFLDLVDQIEPYLATAAGVRKVPEMGRTPAAPVPSGQLPSIESADPNQYIDLMGHKERAVRQRAVAALSKSGSACLPIVLGALAHEYLGVRIAAWKIVRGLKVTDLEFDPWAPQVEREEAVRKLREQLSNPPKRSD